MGVKTVPRSLQSTRSSAAPAAAASLRSPLADFRAAEDQSRQESDSCFGVIAEPSFLDERLRVLGERVVDYGLNFKHNNATILFVVFVAFACILAAFVCPIRNYVDIP